VVRVSCQVGGAEMEPERKSVGVVRLVRGEGAFMTRALDDAPSDAAI